MLLYLANGWKGQCFCMLVCVGGGEREREGEGGRGREREGGGENAGCADVCVSWLEDTQQ